jgi:hypothetical protein
MPKEELLDSFLLRWISAAPLHEGETPMPGGPVPASPRTLATHIERSFWMILTPLMLVTMGLALVP